MLCLCSAAGVQGPSSWCSGPLKLDCTPCSRPSAEYPGKYKLKPRETDRDSVNVKHSVMQGTRLHVTNCLHRAFETSAIYRQLHENLQILPFRSGLRCLAGVLASVMPAFTASCVAHLRLLICQSVSLQSPPLQHMHSQGQQVCTSSARYWQYAGISS